MIVLNVNYVKLKTGSEWVIKVVMVMLMTFSTVSSLTGPNVCVENKAYNVTKLVKYKVPITTRTYEWCMAIPPRCSKWKTEMQYVTKQESEERTAEVAVCCPGYEVKGVACVFSCPLGKYGPGCSLDCPPDRWGRNCEIECNCLPPNICSSINGHCICEGGKTGEKCEFSNDSKAISVTPTMLKSTTANTKTSTATPAATNKNILTVTTDSTTFVRISETNNEEKYVEIVTIRNKATKKTKDTETPEMAIITEANTEEDLRSKSKQKSSKPPMKTASTVVDPTYTLDLLAIRPETITPPTSTTELTTESTTESSTHSTTELNEPSITELSEPSTTDLSSTSTTTTTTTTCSIPSMTTAIPIVTSTTTFIPSTTKDFDLSTTTKGAQVTTESYEKEKNSILLRTLFVTTLSAITSAETSTVEARITEKKLIGKAERNQHFPTIKFTPREFWIKPAQKGEASSTTKFKAHNAQPFFKISTKKELFTSTTPKTIIVSIIPTSITYPTFKKLLLTTMPSQNHQQYKKRCQEPNLNSSHDTSLSTESFCITFLKKLAPKSDVPLIFNPSAPNVSTITFPLHSTKKHSLTTNNTINRMQSTTNEANSPSYLATTIKSRIENVSSEIIVTHVTTESPTTLAIVRFVGQSNNTTSQTIEDFVNAYVVDRTHLLRKSLDDRKNTSSNAQKPMKPNVNNIYPVNAQMDIEFTSSTNTVKTQIPAENETFHILTEPEQITAVITDDERIKARSLDLLTVLTVAGAVMMSVITVAVIIVMIERCKKPANGTCDTSGAYSTLDLPLTLSKTDTLDMKTCSSKGPQLARYIQNIYKTPLPAPPMPSDHYQPIDTLDRTLKPFMRPVAVKQLTPHMIDNFRDILECHYDHLPRRNMKDFQQSTISSPSMCATDTFCNESYRTSTLSATTSNTREDHVEFSIEEPLYAEIPGWGQTGYDPTNETDTYSEATTEL